MLPRHSLDVSSASYPLCTESFNRDTVLPLIATSTVLNRRSVFIFSDRGIINPLHSRVDSRSPFMWNIFEIYLKYLYAKQPSNLTQTRALLKYLYAKQPNNLTQTPALLKYLYAKQLNNLTQTCVLLKYLYAKQPNNLTQTRGLLFYCSKFQRRFKDTRKELRVRCNWSRKSFSNTKRVKLPILFS